MINVTLTENEARVILTALESYNATLDPKLHVFRKQSEMCSNLSATFLAQICLSEIQGLAAYVQN